ncbi:MAG TPA: sugar transferase [Roseiflexaceae bacterium]|nr:sugar transferase [Roseiflexaceae bacterium]HMP39504.1 sugar transferase [Roseiflexaceae bacterium]
MTTRYRDVRTPPAEPHVRISSGKQGTYEADAWLAFLALADQSNIWRLLYTRWIKRCIDCVAALVLLLLLSPLLLMISLAIRLESPGPAIFRQTRIGRGGKPFTILKFRTMLPDRRQSTANGQHTGIERRQSHKTRRNPRVTRLGRFLRRTSLDELPQLVNILVGQMSFVGPRPELPEIVDSYASWQHQRHLVTPGLTGWWQIEGRSERPMHDHTDLDIYYVVHISPMLDVIILLRTFLAVLRGHGAF